jgi:hypothetical protein
MSESDSALPLDSTIWQHIAHMDFTIGIPVSENKTLNILGALEDLYDVVDKDPEEAKQCIIALAAIFVASRHDKADLVWEELSVQESMAKFDEGIREILNEKP